jgi:hypothetical protein
MAVNSCNVHYYERYVKPWRYEAPAYPLPANRSPSPARARSEVQPRTPRMQAPSVPSPGPYIKHWGVYPQQDRGKSHISVADVDALAERPRRLPARFANKLSESGESGMGYTIFRVVFADGSRQAYGTGNAVDFIRYPDGKGQSDVVDVLPPRGTKRRTSNLSRVLLVPLLRLRVLWLS